MIPFLEHDDANRALMGSNMQRQAVPLLKTEPPLVGTGMEEVVGSNSSMVVKAEHAGTVTAVDATHIVINHTDEYKLGQVHGAQRADLSEPEADRQARAEGRSRARSSPTAAAPPTASWPWARTCWSAFVSFDGYNFEDAIIVSERLVKNDSFTSIHIDEFTAEVRETRLGNEEFTRDIPNVSEKALRNLDEHGMVREGTRVCPGDILVGKVVPKSKTELTPEEKLLHAIFGRAGEDVKNDSLELPSGYEGVVIKTEVFTPARRRRRGPEEGPGRRDQEVRAGSKSQGVLDLPADDRRDPREVRGRRSSTPTRKQKVGASEDDEVVYEQIENFDIKWVKPASAAGRRPEDRGQVLGQDHGSRGREEAPASSA